MQETKCCLRNEKFNKGAFKWTPQWALPLMGILTFDLVYLPASNRPQLADEIDDDQLFQLVAWFQREA